jgi:hypothetical protein
MKGANFMKKVSMIRKILLFSLCLTILSTFIVVKPAEAAQATDDIIAFGHQYLGVPYQFGADPYPISGRFDCSSFAQWCYSNAVGIQLPRVSRDQATRGIYIAREHLQKGDLVFFYTTSSGPGNVGHVGIYAGNGQVLHTYGEGGVRYSSITSGWWNDHYLFARRLVLTPAIAYCAHVQDIGWMAASWDGQMAGTMGQSKRMEAFNCGIYNFSSNVNYRAYVENYGWLGWVSNGAQAGTTGQGLRLEAFQMTVDSGYHVTYRAHVSGIGWQGWVRDGQTAGTTGQSRAVEAIQVIFSVNW